eukprot:GILK01003511.1.p1 GENE.GILK01003511.1~~GILK01003511.1.p1  ORF type:complete len:997 (+),score=186.65 GILK01003511.1:119-2992(+)
MEAEQKRVEKELAKIRANFTAGGAKATDGYQKKKYVWKMIYMWMLGYDIDFGHMEAVNLITSPRFSEKNSGYVACAMLLSENAEVLRLITNSVRSDLLSKNDAFQCLALSAVGNVGGSEFAENLAPDVQKLLMSNASRPNVKKKAALCLLRLFRKIPSMITADQWASRFCQMLDDRSIAAMHLGVLLSLLGLLVGVLSYSSAGYEEVVPRVIRVLTRLVLHKECSPDYCYYLTPSPWVQVRCLKILQFFPPPMADVSLMNKINEVLTRILTKTEVTKSVNKNNADHGILFEAANVIIHYDVDVDADLKNQALVLLGRFISVREPNIRYLGLETMSRLAAKEDSLDVIKKHQPTILVSLKDADISIRRRALDLLYSMCDRSNSQEIVSELLDYLVTADFNIREELVLKVAILAEKYAPDFTWYIDVVLKLVRYAGDYVSDDIWFRVIQIVTGFEEGANNAALQKYAALKVFEALAEPGVHETMVKIGSYILGEFGHLICEDESRRGDRQFQLLHKQFTLVTVNTKQQLMTTYVKFANLYPELRGTILQLFEQFSGHLDAEVQQRAVEYSVMLQPDKGAVAQAVLEMMPTYSEKVQQNSLLIRRIRKLAGDEPAESGAAVGRGSLEEATGEDAFDRASRRSDAHDTERSPSRSMASVRSREPVNDLLDMGGDSPAGSASILAAAPKAAQSIFDELDPVAASATTPMTPQERLQHLLVNNSGTLYDDAMLSIELQSEFHGAAGRLILNYLNKSGGSIEALQAMIPPVNFARINMSPLSSSVPARASVQQFVQIDCLQPFMASPILQIRFNSAAGPRELSLPLPVVIHKFIEPHQLDGGSFMKYWADLAGQPREVQMTAKASPRLAPLNGATVGSFVSAGFRLGVLNGVDPNPNNTCAVGTFHTATPTPNQPGKMISVACMVRIETNPAVGGIRVTVRAAHGQVSQALCGSLMNHLGAVPM